MREPIFKNKRAHKNIPKQDKLQENLLKATWTNLDSKSTTNQIISTLKKQVIIIK